MVELLHRRERNRWADRIIVLLAGKRLTTCSLCCVALSLKRHKTQDGLVKKRPLSER